MNNNDWTPRKRIEADYQGRIQRLIDRFIRLPDSATLGHINELLVNWQNYWRYLQWASEKIAERMFTDLRVSNSRSWRAAASRYARGKEIYESIRTELRGPHGEKFRAIIHENSRLISSIPDHIRESANREISSMERQGFRAETIAEHMLKRIPQLTKSRAAMIARTETSKSAAALTRVRSEALGIPAYIWETSRDSRVRRSHRMMQGVIVFWNDPPNPEQLAREQRVKHGPYHAGNWVNCRCDSFPLLRLDAVTWPRKVYWNGAIRMITLARFKRLTSPREIAA